MSRRKGGSYRGRVLIRIWAEGAGPVSGRVETETGESQEFVGWLALLAILSRELEPERGVPHGELGGELDP